MQEKFLEITNEVREALENRRAVVALESTIIAHGMPFPQNMETALEVERIVREHGAVPATIAIIDGKLKVGLSHKEIELIAKKGSEVAKVSRRDIPFILASHALGATTVAATMLIANLAGIKIFATGGIGGVHRDATHSFDISADLQELANTNVYVVCAGIKSILDLGLTLEYLETFGVPLVGFGTKELSAFYTRKSGFEVNYAVQNVEELVSAIRSKEALGLKGGMVIANPIPHAHEMNPDDITLAIDAALTELNTQHIRGKASTPFLLAKVKEITGGKSLESNIQLVYNNAKLAAQIAKSLELVDANN